MHNARKDTLIVVGLNFVQILKSLEDNDWDDLRKKGFDLDDQMKLVELLEKLASSV